VSFNLDYWASVTIQSIIPGGTILNSVPYSFGPINCFGKRGIHYEDFSFQLAGMLSGSIENQ